MVIYPTLLQRVGEDFARMAWYEAKVSSKKPARIFFEQIDSTTVLDDIFSCSVSEII